MQEGATERGSVWQRERARERERLGEWESKRMMDIRTNEWVYSQSMILWFWLVGLDKLQGDKHTLEN